MQDTKDLQEPNRLTLELGIALGQRRAFGMMAGRCSAAHAESLRKIREEKLYLDFAPTWPEYCARFLKISSRTADRTIALLKKHGPLYFEAAALTGISPAQYERVAPYIQADGIHAGDEVIALIPQNADRAMQALARLEAEADAKEAPKPQPTPEERIVELEKRAEQLSDAFHKTAPDCSGADLRRLYSAVHKIQHLFKRLELEIK